MPTEVASAAELVHGLGIQRRVVYALLMREVITRTAAPRATSGGKALTGRASPGSTARLHGPIIQMIAIHGGTRR